MAEGDLRRVVLRHDQLRIGRGSQLRADGRWGDGERGRDVGGSESLADEGCGDHDLLGLDREIAHAAQDEVVKSRCLTQEVFDQQRKST